MVTENSILSHAKVSPWQELEGKVLVLTPQASSVHELNETAAFIWKNIDGIKSLNIIAELMAEEFEIELNQATSDALDLAKELLQKEMIIEC